MPARHKVDLKKANRDLELSALIMGLCQFYGVPVAPSKVIRPPTNRPFIKKYYAPLGRCRVRHHNSLGMTGSEQ